MALVDPPPSDPGDWDYIHFMNENGEYVIQFTNGVETTVTEERFVEPVAQRYRYLNGVDKVG